MIDGTAQILLIALSFALAGAVKGLSGMGLPTVAMGLLGLLMAPVEAAALLVVPSLVTNVWQFVTAPDRALALRRMWPMLLAIGITTWAGAGLIARVGAAHATAALGIALAAYSIIGMCQVRIAVPRRHEAWLSPLVGAVTGIVTGATGVLVVPAAPYLQGLGLEKDDLVQALGLSFTVSTLALAAGLATYGALHLTALRASVVCTAPALAGMLLGQAIRARIDPPRFRLLFLIGLLLLGGELIGRAVL